eukprot:XP_017946503.1 PREDICTED: uncharacterized protein LOC100495012 [Xenopus tropicalis]
MKAHTSKVTSSAVSTYLNSTQPVVSHIFHSSVPSTPAGPLIAVSTILPEIVKASSVSVTTAPPLLQSTPGIQPGASPEDPSISMTTAHPQSPVTKSSVSPAGPLIAVSTILPETVTASSVSVTTAPPQSTPGIQPGASPEDPSISMTTAHPQSTPVTKSSVSPAGIYGIIGGTILLLICVVVLLRTHACHRGKKHRYKPKHLWANHHSTDMENEIAGKTTALLDQDTNDKLHIYCEVEITLDPLTSKKPASSPKPKPAVVPTIPPPSAMPPILLPPQSDALLKSKVAHVKTGKLQAQHADALLDSTVMKMNPLYGDFSSK